MEEEGGVKEEGDLSPLIMDTSILFQCFTFKLYSHIV